MLRLVRYFLFAIAVTVSCFQTGYGQHANYIRFTVGEGLPSDEVYQIKQDSSGFYWFATDRGVARYDGKQFESFVVADGLVDNTIFGMASDKQGRTWFHGYNGGLCYFDEEEFHTYRYNDEIHEVVEGRFANSIAIDMARYRVRKKLGLSSDQSLYETLLKY